MTSRSKAGRPAASGKAKKRKIGRFLRHPAGKTAVIVVAVTATLGALALIYSYVHFERLTDEKLAAGPIGHTARLYAAPSRIMVGDEVPMEETVSRLNRAGYTESRGNRIGWYHLRADAIEIFPGRDSAFAGEDTVVLYDGKRVAQIISLRDNSERTLFHLEPEFVTNLFNRNREKRLLVRYGDIPKHVIGAVVAAEDKRFFQHAGFDPIRVLKTAYVNLAAGEIREGASTLSMQVAGDIWLDRRQRTWKRKFGEVMITLQLERKLTKEEIFEYYANQIYLGHVGSFAIHGFGQGAQAYFNKDVRHLTFAEAAMLAGLPRGPGLYNPFRNPQRAVARRNWVLKQMLETGVIGERDYALAMESPLGVVQGATDSGEAPYFVDLVNQWLQQQFSEYDFQSHSYRIDTTIDPDLQKDAVEAVRIGLAEVDEKCLRRGRTPEKGWPPMQVALVAMDPHTGAVKAVIGGRSYAQSQLNRVSAKRPPGSSFKPFVFAAALSTAVEGGPLVLTPQSRVMDEPTTFWFDEKPYEPHGYKDTYYGEVTIRRALAKSLNVPTVKLAELVGYDRVVEIAQRAGMNMNIQATPAVALGSYEVTPLEITGAYTMFANRGEVLKPYYIQRIRDDTGAVLFEHHPEPRPALDPRIAYLMTNLMEETLRSGTGVRARALGFAPPSAGKTGTSHDGWFAGYTTELLCVVWVGYDDYRDIKMEGAETALPIWTEFMKRAHSRPAYQRARPFEAPEGVVQVDIDSQSGKLAAVGCAGEFTGEVFVAGTQPVELCNGSGLQVAGWDLPGEEPVLAEVRAPRRNRPAASPRASVPPAPERQPEAKRKGIFGRIFDIFR